MLLRYIEKWYPMLGTIAMLVLLLYKNIVFSIEVVQAVCSAFFTIFSICCGFTSTSLSIIFTLQDRGTIRKLKTSNVFYEIIAYHWNAIIWCFMTILTTFLVVISSILKISHIIPSYIMCAVGVGALLTVYRVIHLFVRVLSLDKD